MGREDLPATDVAATIEKFWFWHGDLPAPQISHWTPIGSVIIRAATPGKATEVLWRPKDEDEHRLGYDDIHPYWPLKNIIEGKYDRDAGVDLSALVPKDPSEWNNLA